MSYKWKPGSENERFRIAIRAIILVVVNSAITIVFAFLVLFKVPHAFFKGWIYAVMILNMVGLLSITGWSALKQARLLDKAIKN
jgi:uncharacterized membrane protein YdfJ with MMPL/SSD domain